MTRFGHLAQRLFNTPLAIHPAKADVIVAALADRLNLAVIPVASATGDDYGFAEPDREAGGRADKGYDLAGGVAVVPVHGTLAHKTGNLRPWSGMTGYDGLRQAFLTALTDPEVRAIVLDVDSPGGEVAGCFDLADTIFAARGDKPIWAILNEMAYSAAYAIASAADRVIVPRTGGVGSIGVIVMHVDWSRAIDAAGMKVTLIHHGARKTDGWPEIPLSAEARAAIQADIDRIGDLFCATVARNRRRAAASVAGLEAAVFMGEAGVAAGLADAVMAPDAAFRALIAQLG